MLVHKERKGAITMANTVSFDIQARLGELNRADNGWAREVNIVAWNNGDPKIDIRSWSPEHDKMSKGITLTAEEAVKLTAILADFLQKSKDM